MANFLQPPRLRIGEDTQEERRATWLELFYDLVFVVAVSQLAHNLNEDISLSGLFGIVAIGLLALGVQLLVQELSKQKSSENQ